MTDPVAVANTYWDVGNDGTDSYIDRCTAKGYSMTVDGRPVWTDQAGATRFVRAMLDVVPDTRTDHRILFTVRNAVAARIRTEGTVAKAQPGLPPVGQQHVVEGFAILRIEDGKVAAEDVFTFPDDEHVASLAEETARRYWTTYNRGTTGFVDTCLAADAAFFIDGHRIGGDPDSNRAAAEQVLAQLPDRGVEALAVSAAGRTVCAHIRVTGTPVAEPRSHGGFSQDYIQVLVTTEGRIAAEYNFSG